MFPGPRAPRAVRPRAWSRPLSSFDADSAAALSGPRWLRAERRAAAERFAATPLPTESLEEWRYSRIDALDLDRYAPVPSSPPGGRAQAGDAEELVAAVGPGATLVETHDGHLAGVRGGDRAVEVHRLSAPDARQAALGTIAGEPDALTALNRAFAPVPILVRVAKAGRARPVVVVHRVEADGAAVFPRILVEAGEQAELSVIEVIVGDGDSLVVPVTEVDVSQGARVSYTQVQLLGPRVWQVGLQASRVDRDATFVSAVAAFGGDYARVRTDSSLAGAGSSGRLLALYLGSGSQMHDFRTVQHHAAPRTTSDLFYKGAVANTSRSVYSGLIRVEKGARGSSAMQTNRNLVLDEGAHADSVPNLEIEDNDVRCSHASAVGPIADDQRFYLESRGVPTGVAERLITLGFLEEVLGVFPLPSLVAPIRRILAAKLSAAEALAPAGRWEPS